MKKLISLVTALVIILSLTSCNTKTDEMQSQINDLQSQVSSLQSEVVPESSEPIPEEDIPEESVPTIDLKPLAEKIIKECPPPDGVELVIDTEDIIATFRDTENYDFDTTINILPDNAIEGFVRIYNPNLETGTYYIVIAKLQNEEYARIAQKLEKATRHKMLTDNGYYFNKASEIFKNTYSDRYVDNTDIYMYDIMITDDAKSSINQTALDIIFDYIKESN